MIIIMQPLQSVRIPIIKIQKLLCSPLTTLFNHYLMLHRHWRINILRNQRSNNHILIVLHRFGIEKYIFLQGNWKSIAMKLIYPLLWQQLNILRLILIWNLQNQDMFSPDFEGEDDECYLLVQNPTQAPIISKDFLRKLPHCPIIHWVPQMCNSPKLCF